MEISRIKTAIEFLKDGQSFSVDDIRLGVRHKTITVTGWSQYSAIENLTKQQALKELCEIQLLFKKMLSASSELTAFITDKKIEYNLYFDDYGKGSIAICSQLDREVTWQIDLK